MTFTQALAWFEGALAELRELRPDFAADSAVIARLIGTTLGNPRLGRSAELSLVLTAPARALTPERHPRSVALRPRCHHGHITMVTNQSAP